MANFALETVLVDPWEQETKSSEFMKNEKILCKGEEKLAWQLLGRMAPSIFVVLLIVFGFLLCKRKQYICTPLRRIQHKM